MFIRHLAISIQTLKSSKKFLNEVSLRVYEEIKRTEYVKQLKNHNILILSKKYLLLI